MIERPSSRCALLAIFVAVTGCEQIQLPVPPPSAGSDEQNEPDGGTRSRSDGGFLFDGGVEEQPDAGLPPTTITGASLIYSVDRTQSPIDSATVQHLKDIVSRGSGRPGVFARVGDSVSIGYEGVTGSEFLNCFDAILEGTVSWDVNIRLGTHSALAPTIGYFKATSLGTNTSSWTRISLATKIGMTAKWPTTGSPSPIDQELAAINPRYAVVLYGSNDINWGGPQDYPLADQVENYEKYMRALVDHLLSKGVIPIVNTMPPKAEYPTYAPVFASAMRAIAQGRQVPLIDLYRELILMGPPYGLRSDGTHPSYQDYNTCCWFDPTSLAKYGANVRNLITLEAFDRMRQIFEDGVTTFDPAAEHLEGDGSTGAPFVIDQVPWGELRDLRHATTMATGSLSCPDAPAVSGQQVLYRLQLSRPMALRVLVVNGGAGGHEVSLLSDTSLSTCVKTDGRLITTRLAAGTWYIVVNALSPTSGSEYNLSVTECVANDPDCRP